VPLPRAAIAISVFRWSFFMRNSFRSGFYIGLSVVLLAGLFLIWLWRPQRQIERHTDNFLRAVARSDWTRMADFIAPDYQDQWGNDRGLLLERTRELFRYLRNVRFIRADAIVGIDHRNAIWQGKITVSGDENEVMMLLKDRVNSVKAPFTLQWRRLSGKPWDWKLTRISNPELAIPDYVE
jgi:hypothetical protein